MFGESSIRLKHYLHSCMHVPNWVSRHLESVFELVYNRLIPVLDLSIGLQDILLRLTFDNVCMISFGVDPGCSQPHLFEIPFAIEATLLIFWP